MVRTTRLGHPGVGRLRAVGLVIAIGFMLLGAGVARAAEPTVYAGTETIPVPPASNFSGSAGGDGWAVGLTSDRVYNVFHHQASTTVNCHNQSDSSTCWSSPKTITDGSGNNFSTSIAPGLYVDQNTGHLYVTVVRTSDDVAGVLCIDTTQPDSAPGSALYCGFTALTPAGEGSNGAADDNGLSDPVQVGSDWYFMDEVPGVPAGAEDQMLCFDLATQAACANQPYPVDLGGAQYGGMSYSYPIGAAGSDIFVQVVGSTSKLACFDATNPTVGTCGGSWPVSVSGGQGAPYPLLDGSGNVQGVCDPLGTIVCFDLSGNSVATPPGMGSAISGTYQYNGPAVVIGPRVYVPEASANAVGCYDYSAGAGCPNFPKTFSDLDLLYTVNADFQRPACLWVNADNGTQIQNFDAYTGGSCGQGPVRALVSQFVNAGSSCTPSTYSSLQITSPANPSGTVQFADGDGNVIPGSPTEQIGPNGMVDLSGVNLKTSNGLPQFLISLNNGASASALTMVLTWTAPYVATCASDSDGDTSAVNPAITATGTSITATAGQSFTKAVATFSDPDNTAKPSDYSASINWGDGSTSVGTITGTAAKFTVTGTHTYAKAGSYSVTVSITDKDGSGNNATVTDPAKVAAGATPAAVKAKKVKRGSARLSGVGAACVRHAIRARVTGVQIASVTFALDGRRMHTRTVRSGRTYVATFAVSKGGHRVTVTVHFKKSSRTAARRFARVVSACTLPTFTG